MRAVVCHHAELTVDEGFAEPRPGKGQVTLQVARCGICGSDLHARTGIDEWATLSSKLGYHGLGRSTDRLVFGHEFSGVVAEHGPGCRKTVAEGALAVAFPLLRGPQGVEGTGLSPAAPGGYAERLLVEESLMLEVPNGLAADVAALTEPLAVAYHAVRRGEVGKRDVAVVIGCGPIGLAVILCLKARGVRTVVAADHSAGRRALATRCGADVVVDPRETSPYDAAPRKGELRDAPSGFELAVSTTEKLGRLPFEQWPIWRLAERLGAGPKHRVVFECVGVPGILESVIQQAPLFARVVVVGVCVGSDAITPAMAINKELDLRFVLGYTPLEFRDTLHLLADGTIDPRPLITGTVGLDGVATAFEALGDPEAHAKILVDPSSTATTP